MFMNARQAELAAVLAILRRQAVYFDVPSIKACMPIGSVICGRCDVHELYYTSFLFDVVVDCGHNVFIGSWDSLFFLYFFIS